MDRNGGAPPRSAAVWPQCARAYSAATAAATAAETAGATRGSSGLGTM